MPLPDENKGKSARDLIARFQTNINATSEAPLKPRHSFGSNERFEGDNSNPDISEAKRNPSTRINNARASLEAGLSALTLSRSASGASASSSSLSSTSRERPTADAASKQPVAHLEDNTTSESADNSGLDISNAPSTPQKAAQTPLEERPNATEEHAPENNNETIPETKEQIKTSECTSAINRTAPSAHCDLSNQAESMPDPPTSSVEESESATIVDTLSKPKDEPVQPTEDDSPSSTLQENQPTAKASILAKTRNIPKTASPLNSPNKAAFTNASTKLPPPPSKSSSSVSKTPQKASTSSISAPSVTKSVSAKAQAKTPSRPTPANTPRTRNDSTLSPATFARRSVISPSPASTSSSLARPTEAVTKAVESSQIEHASEIKKATPSTRTAGAASAFRNNQSSSASGSTSRPTSVISSGSTAKARRTPLMSSTSSRRTASEETNSKDSSSISVGPKSSAAQRGASGHDTGKSQAASTPSSSKTALAKPRKGGLAVPSPASTPAKSPTKLLSTSNTASPASTPPSGDTLARLMRPTIASQAHARSPARSPVASSPTASTSAGSRLTGGASQMKSGSPAALKKARSYAGTAAAGSKAKVPRESIAKVGKRADTEASVKPVEDRLNGVESEQLPKDEDIPEIPAEDEFQEDDGEEQYVSHSQESLAGQSESKALAPPESTTSSSAAGASEVDDFGTGAAESNGGYIPTEKVFTGFGPNRPYGKIGLPTEEATAEEAASRPVDEENKILPPNLRIKQPRDLEDVPDGNEATSKQEVFADKWGSRDIGSNPLPLKNSGMTSTKSDEAGNDANKTETGNGNGDGKTAEKKVPIWMRKGEEA